METSSKNLLVAVVDDDPLFRDMIEHLLKLDSSIRVEQADSSRGLSAILKGQKVDCILLDYDLGSENGLTILENLKSTHADIPPIIMLTGDGRENTAIRAFRGGVSDYLPKRTLSADQLIRTVREAVASKDATDLKKAEIERLSRHVMHDNVTGLFTRDYMNERLDEVNESAGRTGNPYACLLIEINGLIHINDRHGHVIGDKAMRAFADRLKQAQAPGDMTGRWDKGTFLYLIETKVTAERIETFSLELVKALTFMVNFDEMGFKLAPTIGAAISPYDGKTGVDVVAAAGRALQDAKIEYLPYRPASLWPDEQDRKAKATPSPVIFDSEKGGLQTAALSAPPVREAMADEVPEWPGGDRRQGDRRRERRQRVLKRGQIVLKGFGAAIDCTVRDLSSSGAKVRVDVPFAAPEHFELLFIETGVKKNAQLRWQIGKDIGVEFMP